MTGISRLFFKELGSLRYVAPQLATSYFDQFPDFCQMLTDAKSTAKRSILIDHCGVEHIDLKNDFRNIEHVYSIEKETKRGTSKLSLIEFKNELDAESIVKQARHNEGLLPVPLRIFRYIGNSNCISPEKQDLPFPVDNVKLSYRRELYPNSECYTDLLANNMMSLVNFKMRLLTLVNFENVLCAGVFGQYELLPFGSSVIDLGCDMGDLDIVVTRKDQHCHILDPLKLAYHKKSHDTNNPFSSKLVHLDKSLYSEIKDNSGIRGTMLWFDHILKEFMPLTDGYGVLFVRYAKVPIIKFTARITSIDCDLSFNLGLDQRESAESRLNNSSGILMAQILYSLCRNNSLFTAVTIYLRIFGKLTTITSKEPNIGLTNFQYLSLIIFYLQQVSIAPSSERHSEDQLELIIRRPKQEPTRHDPIVPPFKDLLSANFTPKGVCLTPDQIEKLLPEAVTGFFKFYSDFDFRRSSLNLFESKVDRKLDNSALDVTNPIERSKNICHNVNRKGLEQFVKQVKAASRCLIEEDQSPLTLINSLFVKQVSKKIK